MSPDHIDWSELYPAFCKPSVNEDKHDDFKDVEEKSEYRVEFADVGCGYGGLLGNYILTDKSKITSAKKCYTACFHITLLPVILFFSVTLSEMFPETLMVGMEIRVKVSDYVMDRISALREKYPGKYQNIACIRTNAMKYLPNYFRKAQVRISWLACLECLTELCNMVQKQFVLNLPLC